MIEKYFSKELCERFQNVRLSVGGRCWVEDDYFISFLLDYYDEFESFKVKYRKILVKYSKLKVKFKMLKSKFKVFYLFNKLLYEK